MWHLTACKVSVSLLLLNEMIFYCVSELMLPTLIQRYDEKSFHFHNINLLDLSWIKMSIFEEYGAFKMFFSCLFVFSFSIVTSTTQRRTHQLHKCQGCVNKVIFVISHWNINAEFLTRIVLVRQQLWYTLRVNKIKHYLLYKYTQFYGYSQNSKSIYKHQVQYVRNNTCSCTHTVLM